MKIALGADERAHVVEVVRRELEARGHEVLWFGPRGEETLPWPQVARQAAEAVVRGQAAEAVLFCWTGTGVSLAANKVPGIRAALCDDAETARGARLWNDANVLCLSIRRTSPVIAREILEAWFGTAYQPNPTDDACLQMVAEMDAARGPSDTIPA